MYFTFFVMPPAFPCCLSRLARQAAHEAVGPEILQPQRQQQPSEQARGFRADLEYLRGVAPSTDYRISVTPLNQYGDAGKPLFVDAEAKDYRMAQGSQALDMVPASAWMGTGRKKGPQDLGSGCEMAAVGDYGVTISRLDASCRLSGELADAGCTEYQKKLGLMLLFR